MCFLVDPVAPKSFKEDKDFQLFWSLADSQLWPPVEAVCKIGNYLTTVNRGTYLLSLLMTVMQLLDATLSL